MISTNADLAIAWEDATDPPDHVFLTNLVAALLLPQMRN